MPKTVLDLALDRVPSALGTLLVVYDGEQRVRALDFEDHEPRLKHFLRLHYGASGYSLAEGAAPNSVMAGLAAFFAGEIAALDQIAVASGGTDFQRCVWAALRRIPGGTTTTYGQLAATIGHPSASRAVGAANGANPIGIIVPCHRVIGSNGELTGYGGGIERKRWLLEHERRWAPARIAAKGSAQ